jgi:hypothetical protein
VDFKNNNLKYIFQQKRFEARASLAGRGEVTVPFLVV